MGTEYPAHNIVLSYVQAEVLLKARQAGSALVEVSAVVRRPEAFGVVAYK